MSAKDRADAARNIDGIAELPVGLMAELFEHVADTAFFVKDAAGRYVAVNRSLAARVGVDDPAALVGRGVHEFFPADLARRYSRQDEAVLRTGRPLVDKLELHWYPHRRAGWCLTTKLPLREAEGSVIGLVGVSRDIGGPAASRRIPAGLARALDALETRFDEMTPSGLAEMAGVSPVRFARLIKRLFRVTPIQMISQARIAAASRMLEETAKPVAEIAHACGFYDHSAFTRAFRVATGTTPTAYRLVRRPPK